MTIMLRLIVQRHWRQHQSSLRGLFKECDGRQPYLNEQVCLCAACQNSATDGILLSRATGSQYTCTSRRVQPAVDCLLYVHQSVFSCSSAVHKAERQSCASEKPARSALGGRLSEDAPVRAANNVSDALCCPQRRKIVNLKPAASPSQDTSGSLWPASG